MTEGESSHTSYKVATGTERVGTRRRSRSNERSYRDENTPSDSVSASVVYSRGTASPSCAATHALASAMSW